MKLKLITAALLPVFMAGCATQNTSAINKEVESSHKDAQAYLEKARKAAPVESAGSVQRVSGLYLPTRKMPANNIVPVNKELSRKFAINRPFSSIQDVAERVTAMTGVPVMVSPEAAMALTGAPGTPGMAGAAGGIQGGMPGAVTVAPMVPGIDGAVPMNAMGLPVNPPLVYSGTIAGFLDVAAARYGVYWEWDDQRKGVRFFRTTTRTFRMAALPGDTTLQAKISNSSGGSSGSSSGPQGGGSSSASQSASNQETGVSFSGLSVWKSIEDGIKAMLTTNGKVVVTAATGTVTVSDNPRVLADVERYIEQQNAALGRQVVVNVRVLAVDLTDSDAYGINWNIVYQSLSGIGLTLAGATAPITGATGLGLQVLSSASKRSGLSTLAGSEAVIEALSKQGRVKQVTSASVTTLNNQPAPLQVGTQTSYLATSTTTIGTGGAGNTVSLTPGLITTGFSMNLMPHMLSEKELLLQYAVDLSSLKRIDTVTSGGSSIQTPEIDTRNFIQRVKLNSGDTLVVTGFEQTNLAGNLSGIGKASNSALGGGNDNQRNKTVIVMLLQPVVAEN